MRSLHLYKLHFLDHFVLFLSLLILIRGDFLSYDFQYDIIRLDKDERALRRTGEEMHN